MYKPRFFVTQEDYDAASPSERLRYNYVVDDRPLSLPKYFNICVQEKMAELALVNRIPVIN